MLSIIISAAVGSVKSENSTISERRFSFEVSVACYPEVHPQAASARSDLDQLKPWDR